MLNGDEQNRIYQQAYVPEHLHDYVTAISGGEPYLFQDHLCYIHRNHLIFIGYPLTDNPAEITRVYAAACERFNPHTVVLVADEQTALPEADDTQPSDHYYRLNLPLKTISPDVAYMVRRAERELKIEVGRFGREHKKIINDFIGRQDLSDEQAHIFKHVKKYLKRSKTALLLEARKDGRLAALSIVDMGSARFAFYQFSFRSSGIKVPGASDLLFSEMVQLAQSEGKQAINLGLSVNPGIRRFKEKWGGEPFLEHHSALIKRKQAPDIGQLSKKL